MQLCMHEHGLHYSKGHYAAMAGIICSCKSHPCNDQPAPGESPSSHPAYPTILPTACLISLLN